MTVGLGLRKSGMPDFQREEKRERISRRGIATAFDTIGFQVFTPT
jgi:hypothetical protein